jgi:hypothetical protein
VAGFDLAQKERAGDAIIMRWMMTMTTMMTMAREVSKGKSINNSISEHKCILFIIPINNNCSSVSVTRLQVRYLPSLRIPSTSLRQAPNVEEIGPWARGVL